MSWPEAIVVVAGMQDVALFSGASSEATNPVAHRRATASGVG